MPIGSSSAHRARSRPERVARRQPALLHRGRRPGGEADHVADGVDVLDRSSGSARRRRSGRACRPPARRSRGPRSSVAPWRPGGVHHGVGGDLLAAGQRGQRAAVVLLDRRHLLAEPEHHRRGRAGGTAAPRRSRSRRTRAAGACARRRSPWCPARRTSTRTRCRSRPRRPPPSTAGMRVQVEDAVGVEDRPPRRTRRPADAPAACRWRSRSAARSSVRVVAVAGRDLDRVRVDEPAVTGRARARGCGPAGCG